MTNVRQSMRVVGVLVLVLGCGSDLGPTSEARGPRPAAVIAARLPAAPGAFAPSLVAVEGTRTGEPSDGELMSDVDSCAACHADAAAQWATSPHSFASFGNPIYRVNVELVRDELGRDASRHCGGCHDMPLMVDGLMAQDVSATDLRAHSGVTCRLCHGIERVSKDGNGSYVWSRASLDAPVLGDAASIAQHRAEASVTKLGSELCVACHRGFLSPDMGQGMPVHLSGLDEPGAWRNSAWTGNGVARIDDVEPRSCIDCHMEREPAGADEVSAHEGTIASHRFLGGHTWMAGMRGDTEHLRRLQAKLVGVASIDIQPWRIGERRVELDVVIRNLLVGHRFPGGVLDIQDTWIEVEVHDARGRRIAQSGLAHERDPHDHDTHVLRTLVVDQHGRVLEHHEMPRFRAQIQTQTLAPREAQAIRYVLDVPRGAALPLAVTARLRHRSRTLAMQAEVCRAAKRADGRAFLSGARGARDVELDPCRPQPITSIAQTTASLATPSVDWQRVYEHGMALTSVVSERLDEPRGVLERALALVPPGNARARAMVVVQLAQVAAKQGRADDALALVRQARALVPAPGPAALDAIEADALMRVWRWQESLAPAAALVAKAPANSYAWMMAARCFGSVGDNAAALAAATTGLELAPRDPDLLRSQATALGALRRPEAEAALAAYDRYRTPDHEAALRIACAADSSRCEREREQGHTHVLHVVR